MMDNTKKTEGNVILGWGEYHALIRELVSQIPKSKYRYVYGVPRGGLIPAVMISHELEIELTTALPLSPDFYPFPILVVDDLVDSGMTLRKCKHDTATLFMKPDSVTRPTYFGEVTDKLVIFPYEIEKEVKDSHGKT